LDQAEFGNLNYGQLKVETDKMVQLLQKEPKDITIEDINNFEATSDKQKMAVRMLKRGLSDTNFPDFYKDLEEGVKYFGAQMDYHLNKEYDSRTIIGDRYDDASERDYGNPD